MGKNGKKSKIRKRTLEEMEYIAAVMSGFDIWSTNYLFVSACEW